ncbi:MAG: hypothetical protein LBR21_03450 [Propionibacteriaceae bacterium]|nr:hypothetical protein [Propionibacteriaceae bacterium]
MRVHKRLLAVALFALAAYFALISVQNSLANGCPVAPEEPSASSSIEPTAAGLEP